MPKAFVLLSGGIDSTTCLHLAMRDFKPVHAISVNYGQRHSKELKYAEAQCYALGIPWRALHLGTIIPTTLLTNTSEEIPNKSYAEIDGLSPAYVPFRNGLMLSAVASIVHGHWQYVCMDGDEYATDSGEHEEWAIYFGAHREDAQRWAYPDCTPEFIGAMANAIFIGTDQDVRLHTPLQWLNKGEIIKLGVSLGIDYAQTWSCYAGGDMHCGVCPTCRARKAGFAAADVVDPTTYRE